VAAMMMVMRMGTRRVTRVRRRATRRQSQGWR
jgi:hypothetical protein